jgi:hypothetical protein
MDLYGNGPSSGFWSVSRGDTTELEGLGGGPLDVGAEGNTGQPNALERRANVADYGFGHGHGSSGCGAADPPPTGQGAGSSACAPEVWNFLHAPCCHRLCTDTSLHAERAARRWAPPLWRTGGSDCGCDSSVAHVFCGSRCVGAHVGSS